MYSQQTISVEATSLHLIHEIQQIRHSMSGPKLGLFEITAKDNVGMYLFFISFSINWTVTQMASCPRRSLKKT